MAAFYDGFLSYVLHESVHPHKAMLYDNSSSQWARTTQRSYHIEFLWKITCSYESILRELDFLSVPFPHKNTLTHSHTSSRLEIQWTWIRINVIRGEWESQIWTDINGTHAYTREKKNNFSHHWCQIEDKTQYNVWKYILYANKRWLCQFDEKNTPFIYIAQHH